MSDINPERAAADAMREREERIEALIRHAFARLGLAISDEGMAVSYNEDMEREARVILDDEPDGWPLERLAGLFHSGLANDYRIAPRGTNHIEVRFRVELGLDDAV